jgi:hypothetical protein
MATPMEDIPTLVIEDSPDEATGLLLEVRRAMWRHPGAAQALFRALVAEGRRFAETEEGAAVAARLAASETIDSVRVVWDLVTSRALEDDPRAILPSVVLEAFVKSATDRTLEDLIAMLSSGSSEKDADRL